MGTTGLHASTRGMTQGDIQRLKYLSRDGWMLCLSYLEKVGKRKKKKIGGSFKRKGSNWRRVQSPVLAVFLVRLQDLLCSQCFCGAGFMVLSSARALCVHDVCVGTERTFPSNQCGGGK